MAHEPARAEVSEACNIVTSEPTISDDAADPISDALCRAHAAWEQRGESRALRRALLSVLQLLDEGQR